MYLYQSPYTSQGFSRRQFNPYSSRGYKEEAAQWAVDRIKGTRGTATLPEVGSCQSPAGLKVQGALPSVLLQCKVSRSLEGSCFQMPEKTARGGQRQERSTLSPLFSCILNFLLIKGESADRELGCCCALKSVLHREGQNTDGGRGRLAATHSGSGLKSQATSNLKGGYCLPAQPKCH